MSRFTLCLGGAWLLGACADPARPAGPEQTPVVELLVVAGGDHGGRPMTRIMTGAQEIAGDPDGIGTARLSFNPGQETVCFELSVENILLPATASHIHVAPPGVAGPIVLGLTPAPDATGESSGCLSLDRMTIREIMKHPERYYVNVHNSQHPPGAVRSQLAG